MQLEMKRHISLLAIIAAIIVAASSCSSGRQLSYFDDIEAYNEGTMGVLGDYQVRIKPDDELLITVNSLDPKASADYNLPMTNPALAEKAPTTSSSQQQQTYVVNALGDINFPVLGKIHVKGMTTLELTEYLTSRIAERVVDPVVRVALANFNVSVMGEVEKPGPVKVSTERLSVFDALVAAGDLTDYGRRENVLVIREIDGKQVYQRLNLKDSKVVESPFFYLQQNDVVYVEPNSIRQANSKYNSNNAFKLTVISSVISAVSVITSLVIALTR